MLKTLIATLTILSCAVLSATAQGFGVPKVLYSDNGYFNHLDVSVNTGTTGIGVDVSAPIGDYVKVRLGASYMPRFEMTSTFRVQVGDSLERKYDKNGNRIETKFDKLSGMLKSFTGYEVDDEIDMKVKPTYYNFRLLFDVHPFVDKRWHLTAGVYFGSKEIGRAYNSTKDMTSLMAVSMYNMMYQRVENNEPLFFFNDQLNYTLPLDARDIVLQMLKNYGRMGVQLGTYTYDGPIIYNEWDEMEYDDEGNPLREFSKGDPYMMVPDEKSGMVTVVAKAKNAWRPYVGFGYGGSISKDGRTELSFDAGVLFWGGKPHVYTHDGTDLIYDVEGIRGKVGRYVETVKAFPVFPVLEVRLTRRIF